ncbi:hypothetical protein [Rhizohabitans arisaemae]|uniref:hypothetical protein n=1 Tax=Rhizohabitans arisaemae TaxID=2720610 RepID=UPI0024B25AE0|nr:hypothetical protein [Rhizohabitans arisaemae]
MSRRLSSRTVTLGAITALSAIVLSGCATDRHPEPPAGLNSPYAEDWLESEEGDYVEEGDHVGGGDYVEEDDYVEDEVVARCVRRSSEGNGTYQVVADERCDGAGKHSAYIWYYGGKRGNGRVSKGTTIRPRDAFVVTSEGDEINRRGTILRGGFGNHSGDGVGG